MKIFVPMNSKSEIIHELCGDIVYIATIEGCCDDNYFTTQKEVEDFASINNNVIVGKLVWNHKTEEYDYEEI